MKTSTITLAGIALLAGAAVQAKTADLKTVMFGMGVSMEQIQAAMWAGDLPAVAKAADAIADHPKAGGTERLRILATMGTDVGKFKAADAVVHDSAVRLSTVAAKGDVDASLAELTTLQAGCVACHTSFKARLQD